MNENSVVAGGPDDFLTVRHLILSGAYSAIGHALAEEARTRANWAPRRIDPVVNRARWTWFERNWPQQHARMSGVAAAFDVDPERDDLCLDGLSGLPVGSGCSAVYCPAAGSADGRGRMGRNYDFFTMSERQLGAALAGEEITPGDDLPMASRPYVITTYPDDGLASTILTMSTLDSAMEGINEAGLAVALLIADVQAAQPPAETDAPQVGIDSAQLPRFVLDTCENAEQAKQALLGAKQYYHGAQLHYLIADAAGNAFVWEPGANGTEHIIEAPHGPLCVTNHPLHRYPDVDELPADTAESFGTYERARTLTKSVSGAPASGESLRESLDEVATKIQPEEPWRTLWRSVFDFEARTMSTRFYLGDNADGTARRSEELVFGAKRP
ncbi:C45 family peptidase [Amycolatopsis anabasis]|uniref:C45 family peptidase n=1 Tax=Amycolatopsis anabasis TaxID=1840409 RepID=UPI00131E04B2|nr:C45 family peptidase [Amycolatopsis anabasis]